MNLKNQKHFIQSIFVVRVNLKMMALKIIQYFRRHIDILNSINDSNVVLWKSKGLFDESIKPPSKSNKMFNHSVNYVGTKARVKFNGDFKTRKI